MENKNQCFLLKGKITLIFNIYGLAFTKKPTPPTSRLNFNKSYHYHLCHLPLNEPRNEKNI